MPIVWDFLDLLQKFHLVHVAKCYGAILFLLSKSSVEGSSNPGCDYVHWTFFAWHFVKHSQAVLNCAFENVRKT